jgi:phospholipid transport system substrate-binding protein
VKNERQVVDNTRLSSTHRIGAGGNGFPLRKMRGLKALGALLFWLMGSTTILWGATTIPESNPVQAKNSPTDAMKVTISQALGVMQDQELKKPERASERVNRLKEIADFRFDYGEMAIRSLGTQWGKLREGEQQEFVDLFTEFLTATYVERIHTYTDEEVRFLDERVEGDHAEVKTIMVGKKTQTPLDYRLMLKDGDWKAYDVVMDGTSLVRSYREQFAAILRSSSYEHLVQMLREKVVQFNVKTKSADPNVSSR